MVTDDNYTYCDEHFVKYKIVESLYIPETNVTCMATVFQLRKKTQKTSKTFSTLALFTEENVSPLASQNKT